MSPLRISAQRKRIFNFGQIGVLFAENHRFAVNLRLPEDAKRRLLQLI
jgi:hypothetical protein